MQESLCLQRTGFVIMSVILVALAQGQGAQPEKRAVPASVSEIVSASTGTEAQTSKNQSPPQVLIGHRGPVISVSFSPDGRRIVSGGFDKLIRLWDVDSGKVIRTFVGHQRSVLSVAFSPDGRQLLSTSRDDSVRLWNVQTGRALLRFKFPGIEGVVFSPDGRSVLSNSREYVASTTLEESVFLWTLQSGRRIRQFIKGYNLGIQGISFSPDGNYAAFEGSDVDKSGIGSGNESVHLINVHSGHEIHRFEGPTEPLYAVTFSPDGREVLAGGCDKTVRLWSLTTGRQLMTFMHPSSVGSVAFAPDGRRILSGEGGFCEVKMPTVHLWDVESGQELAKYLGHSKVINRVAFSPDGTLGLSCSDDGTIRIWRLPE